MGVAQERLGRDRLGSAVNSAGAAHMGVLSPQYLQRSTAPPRRRGRAMRESESAAPETTGPPEQPAAHGIDIREGGRPGVPLVAPERPRAPSSDLEPQRSEPEPVTRVGLDTSTRVYGTAQPLHGVSGWMRRGAYRLAEHRAPVAAPAACGPRRSCRGSPGRYSRAPTRQAGAEPDRWCGAPQPTDPPCERCGWRHAHRSAPAEVTAGPPASRASDHEPQQGGEHSGNATDRIARRIGGRARVQ